VFSCRKIESLKTSRFLSKDIAIPGILFFSGFLYCYWIITQSSRVLQSYHGLYHSATIYQIVNGLIPPTNPLAAESPSVIYWPWHFLVALVMKITHQTSLEAVALLNCLSLSAVLTCIFLICRHFNLSRANSLIAALGSTVLLCPFRYLYALLDKILSTSIFRSIYDTVFSADYDQRSIFFLDKFFNQSSFPTTVGLLAVLLYFFLVRFERKASLSIEVLMGFLVLLLGLFSPIVLVAFNLLIAIYFFSDLRPVKFNQFVCALNTYRFAIVGNLLALPFLISLSKQMGEGVHVDLKLSTLLSQILRSGEAFWIVLVFCLTVFLLHKRKKFLDREFRPILYWLGLLFIAALVLQFPDHNQYKLMLLTSLPLGIGLGYLLERCVVKHAIKHCFFVVIGLSIFTVALVRVAGYWPTKDPYTFSGMEVRLKPSSQVAIDLQDTADWIKKNTHPHAFIMKTPDFRNDLLLPVLSERRAFVAKPASFETKGIQNLSQLLTLNTFLLTRTQSEGRFYIKKTEPQYGALSAAVQHLDRLYLFTERKPSETGTQFAVYGNRSFMLYQLTVE